MNLDPVIWFAVFVVSVTIHEAAHSTVAYLGGDRTAHAGGQVSLNPIPHMRREPLGMVVFPIVTVLQWGFPMGWASAPYDPRWEERHPRRAAWMAAAGPGSNLALGILAFAALKIGLATGVLATPDSVNLSRLVTSDAALAGALGGLLSMLLSMNLILALLNLMPVPPLDGASAITLLMPDDLARRYREMLRGSPLAWIGFIAIFFLFGKIFWPVFLTVAGLLHGASYG